MARSRKKGKGRSIKSDIFLLIVLIAVLPLAVYLFSDIFSLNKRLKEGVEKNFIRISENTSYQLDTMFSESFFDLKLLAETLILNSRYSSREEKIDELEKVRDYKSFDDLTILDTSGSIILSTNGTIDLDLSDDKDFSDALGGDVIITNPYEDKVEGKSFISFFVPITQDGKVVSVLLARMNLERLWEITDKMRVGEYGCLIVLDNQSNIIAHPERELIFEKFDVDVKDLISGDLGSTDISFKDDNGIDYIGYITRMKVRAEYRLNPFFILVVQPKNEAYVMANYIVYRDLLQLVAITSFIILISLYFSARITRPIEAIIGGARRISNGKIGAQVDIKSWQEFEDIAGAFNSMSKSLEGFTEELKKSEEKYRTLIENIDEGYFVLQHGNVIFANEAAYNITGFEKGDALGKNVVDFFPEDVGRLIEKYYDEVLHGEEDKLRFELPFKRGDGKEIYLEFRPKLLSSVEEGIIAGIMVDISAHREREELLKEHKILLEEKVREKTRELFESEKKFRNLFETSKDVIYLSRIEGKLIDINPAAEEFFGYTRDELLKLDTRKLYIDNKERERFQREIGENGFVKDFELTLKKKDGTPIYCIETATLLRNSDGEVIGYHGAIKNITERKRMEMELRNSKNLLQTAFDAVSERMYMVDKDYNLKLANRKILEELDLNYRDILSRKCYSFFNTKEEPCKGCPIGLILEDQLRYKGMVCVWYNDREAFFDVSVYPISTSDEEKDYLVLSRDITEERRMKDHLIQSDHLISLGQLSAMFAHEINNPLAAILGYSQVLLKDIDPKGEEYEDLKIINEQAAKCKIIIDDLLEFARAGVNVKDYFLLNEALNGTIPLVKNEVEKKGIKLETKFQQDMPPFYGDRIRMTQVFLNILNNAVYAVDRGGTISVETSWVESNGRLMVSFIDDGPGISDEDKIRVFDPFFTTKPTGIGTGLGLSVSYGIVIEHGGEILVDSTVGKGSKFTIVLHTAEDKTK